MRDRRYRRERECEHHSSVTNFAIGAALGGLLGAGIALLFAPKAGEELRRDIRDTYEDISDRAEDLAAVATEKSRRMAKKFGCASADFMENARDKGECFVDRAQDRIEDLCEWANIGVRLWQNIKKRR